MVKSHLQKASVAVGCGQATALAVQAVCQCGVAVNKTSLLCWCCSRNNGIADQALLLNYKPYLLLKHKTKIIS